MSAAVVAWHMILFGRSDLFSASEFENHHLVFSDIINFYFLLLPVPVFFLISFFLFFQKAARPLFHVRKRLMKLCRLYCIWTGIYILFYGYMTNYHSLMPDTLHKAIIAIISGYHSAYYFLFSLILLTIIAYIITKSPLNIIWFLLIISLLSLYYFPFLVKTNNNLSFLTAYWNPVNFLPYLFIAKVINDYWEKTQIIKSKKINRLLICISGLFLLSAIFEWIWLKDKNFFLYNHMAIPPYTRLSIATGAVLIFCFSLLATKPPNRIIVFLSRYSLAIYCIHGYFVFFYMKFLPDPDIFTKGVAFVLIIFFCIITAAMIYRICPFLLRT